MTRRPDRMRPPVCLTPRVASRKKCRNQSTIHCKLDNLTRECSRRPPQQNRSSLPCGTHAKAGQTSRGMRGIVGHPNLSVSAGRRRERAGARFFRVLTPECETNGVADRIEALPALSATTQTRHLVASQTVAQCCLSPQKLQIPAAPVSPFAGTAPDMELVRLTAAKPVPIGTSIASPRPTSPPEPPTQRVTRGDSSPIQTLGVRRMKGIALTVARLS